jgi:hypothetical protein
VIAQVNKATSAGDNMLQPEKPISSQTHLATVAMPSAAPDHKAQLGSLADRIWPPKGHPSRYAQSV